MQKRWKPEQVTSVLKAIPDEEYKQRLAELAEIIYIHFCQQRKSQNHKTTTFEPSSLLNEMKRTGTDG